MNRHEFFQRAGGGSAPGTLARPEEDLAPLKVQAGLEVYAEPLDRRRVAHLLRRASFGANPDRVNAWTGASVEEVVDALVDEARAWPTPPTPAWALQAVPSGFNPDYATQNALNMQEMRSTWIDAMYRRGLREKMTLFWHNHFVTGVETYFHAQVAYSYLRTLRNYAVGDLKQFVYDIGLEPAMLIYLDGNTNVKDAPNENYARELMELFTLSPTGPDGEPNYTEDDIKEMARALTGWDVNMTILRGVFREHLFDDGEKSFLGRTGSFGYDDVVEILFEERAEAIAHFISRKLYQEFVYAAADETIVGELATIFLEHDFQIAPVLRALLKSAHFFDDQVIGARIKSPLEMMVGMMIEMHDEPHPDSFPLWAASGLHLDQQLLSPPNVAGWPGHRAWITTASVTTRWFTTNLLIFSPRELTPVDLKPLAAELHDPNDPLAVFHLPLKMAEHFSPVPVETLDIATLEEDFGGDLVGFPIPEEILNGPAYAQNLAKLFLNGAPWYEWSLENEGANTRLRGFLRLLSAFPEFHLT